MSLLQVSALLLGAAGSALGHGYVSSIDVDGTTYGGYLIDTYYYESDPPEVIAWSTTATDNGYVAPDAYADSDIVCHRGAEPGALSAEIAAGKDVTMFWNTWPTSHHGPVINYLAKCDGDCSSADKTTLEFFKIAASGLIDDSEIPGTWASDELISNNLSQTVTIPSDIAAGNYVLRHEIIALHSANNEDGAQNYPQCINLKVTGSGTASPSGTLGTALYKEDDAGIYVNIYQSLSSYDMPGPTLYSAGSTGTATSTTSAASAASTETSSSTTTTAAVESSTTTAAATSSTEASSEPETTSVSSSSTTEAAAAATSAASGSSTGHGKGGKRPSGTCKAHKKRSHRRHARDLSN
ncbi:glycosyl hydrolase family 61-domain-containing protein [Aspergillus californicus]